MAAQQLLYNYEKLKGAQCSEPVKSRVTSRGRKKKDFLLTQEPK